MAMSWFGEFAETILGEISPAPLYLHRRVLDAKPSPDGRNLARLAHHAGASGDLR
jgi:hypothetical protein